MGKTRMWTWFKTEYKRAAYMLPLILKRAVMLAAICIMAVGVITFCAKKYLQTAADHNSAVVRIGYVAQEDMLTELAVAYVEQMESVKSWCSLEKTTFERGMERLEQGELAALLVLPDNLVDEILSGRNTPAKLYLRDAADANVTSGKIFEELANAGIGMLQTAQAEIYVVAGLEGPVMTAEQVQAMYDEINRFNLNIVANRERLWNHKMLSLTGNNTFAVYYASAFLTLYMLVSGLFFGRFCTRNRLQQRIAARRLGISYVGQLVSRIFAVLPLLILVGVLPFLLLLYPPLSKQLSVSFLPEHTVIMFVILLFTAAYLQLVYQLAETCQKAVLPLGLLALFQGYLSGCILPTALLPQKIAAIGMYLPAAYIKSGFTMIFTGSMQKFGDILGGLTVWSLICFFLTWCVMHDVETVGSIRKKEKITHSSKAMYRPFGNSIFAILFKRLLHQKSLWICLSMAVAAAAVIIRIEMKTETAIFAAVYDEEGSIGDELSGYEGLVNFILCDSEDEVRRLVLKDEAECGYIIPENIVEDLIKMRANYSVTVYEDGDAVVSRVVDEVLFHKLFQKASLKWFESYLSQEAAALPVGETEVSEAVADQIREDMTFGVDIERLGANEVQTTFPVQLAAAACMLFCGIQGAAQAVVDLRQNRFYKRNRILIVFITVFQPMILGLLAGLATLWIFV